MDPKPKRRWLQFSLRSLILFTLIGGVASGRLGRMVEEKYDKARAIEEQRKAWDESGLIAAKIKGQLGYSAMACPQLRPPNYVWVSTCGHPTDEAGLDRLAAMPRVGSLNLIGNQITDSDLRRFENMTSLQTLVLHSKAVTDAALSSLKRLPNLRKLNLASTNVSDAAMSELQKALPNCEIARR